MPINRDTLIKALHCCSRTDAKASGCDACPLEYCGEDCNNLLKKLPLPWSKCNGAPLMMNGPVTEMRSWLRRHCSQGTAMYTVPSA